MMKPGIRARHYGIEPELGSWDFDSTTILFEPSEDPSVPPAPRPRWPGQKTFSLGVFQYVPGASGKSLKRGPVARRIVGSFETAGGPADALAEAVRDCRRREEGG